VENNNKVAWHLILRGKVAVCSNYSGRGYMGITIPFERLEQAKIGDLGLEICIQQDVGCLHISMHEGGAA
jgi:hypothetical protein